MKQIIVITLIFVAKLSFAQNNIIPNFSFETGSNSPLCDYQTSLNGFDNDINNWKVAQHNNGKGEGSPDWLDYNSCGYFYCSELGNTPRGTNRFVAIKADIFKCKQNNFKNYHESISVSLPNNNKFINGKDYIIRYKVMPIKAEILSGTNYANCVNNISSCHLRFFLSELGHQGWNQNSSTKQEIINANYQASANQYCGWQVIERNFTCNYGNLTTLVLYAEKGGFLIDDVEIFEKCNGYYLVQNKHYFPQWYNQSLNFGEKSGNELYAGSTIDNSKTFGEVVVKDQSFINYTASDFISLRDGFTAENGSDFEAIIAPCPNYYRVSNFTNDIIFYDELQNENLNESEDAISVFPNPTGSTFKLQIVDEEEYPKQITVHNVLGQRIYSIDNPISFEYEFNLSKENAGIYMVNIYYSDKIISKHLIKE